MKVTAFVGSARKNGNTYKTTEFFLKNLQVYGNIDYEIVNLYDYRIEVCRGCKLCLDKGEELCPLKDDRDLLIDKMKSSDGVIFSSPNYSFQVSGLMKVFLDRIAYFFHRPDFFGKTSTCIVIQGVLGGKNIVKYLDFVGSGLGFNVLKGICLTALEPMTDNARKIFDRSIKSQSKKYHDLLIKNKKPVPSLFKLALFRMSRTMISNLQNGVFKDHLYYKEKGWFTSDYYYPVKLNPVKRFIGKLIDVISLRIS